MVRYSCDELADSRYVISVEGHAMSAPKGRDVVCAAASALAIALAVAVERLANEGRTKCSAVSANDGAVYVDFTPENGEEERAAGIVNTVSDAFRYLEMNYPENVSVE